MYTVKLHLVATSLMIIVATSSKYRCIVGGEFFLWIATNQNFDRISSELQISRGILFMDNCHSTKSHNFPCRKTPAILYYTDLIFVTSLYNDSGHILQNQTGKLSRQ